MASRQWSSFLYQPHVVLMDFYMPRMNGVKAARITKESW